MKFLAFHLGWCHILFPLVFWWQMKNWFCTEDKGKIIVSSQTLKELEKDVCVSTILSFGGQIRYQKDKKVLAYRVLIFLRQFSCELQ